MMRVIAGQYKGSSILSRPDHGIRPTTNRIKEWIFQVIEPFIQGSGFLDLFAGTGGLGIEALSRGCKSAVFVDNKNGGIISKNLKNINAEKQARIYREDVLKFLARRFPGNYRFSLMSADPPYDFNLFSRLFSLIYKSPLLDPRGLFILEWSKHSDIKFPEEFYPLFREKKFGDTNITIFQKGID